MDNWKIFAAVSILMFLAVLAHRIYTDRPECYLIEWDKECGFGYWDNWDWTQGRGWCGLLLRECCHGGDYLLKGVYGEKTCYGVRELK